MDGKGNDLVSADADGVLSDHVHGVSVCVDPQLMIMLEARCPTWMVGKRIPFSPLGLSIFEYNFELGIGICGASWADIDGRNGQRKKSSESSILKNWKY
jgi:hypothetical protein